MSAISAISPQFTSAALEAGGMAMLIADRSGTILEWNRAAVDLTGIAVDDAVGELLWNVAARVAPAQIPYEVADGAVREVFEALFAGPCRQRRFEGEVLTSVGTLRPVEVNIFAMESDQREYAVCLTVSSDQPGTVIPQELP